MSYQAQRWTQIQDLHRTPKTVLSQLAERAKHRTLECFPSQQTLAEDLGMSRRTVGAAMRYLEEQGFIERAGRHHRSNGFRKTDLVRILMEDVRTVVRTSRTYSEYLQETQPSRYAHRRYAHGEEVESSPLSEMSNGNVSPVQWERERGPMGTAFPTMNKKIEVEVEAGSTSSLSREEDAREPRAMHIGVERVDDEWAIHVSDLEDFEDNQPFQDVLGSIIEAALDAGISPSVLTVLLQESWKEDAHWVVQLEEFERAISRIRGRSNLRIVPGVGA